MICKILHIVCSSWHMSALVLCTLLAYTCAFFDANADHGAHIKIQCCLRIGNFHINQTVVFADAPKIPAMQTHGLTNLPIIFVRIGDGDVTYCFPWTEHPWTHEKYYYRNRICFVLWQCRHSPLLSKALIRSQTQAYGIQVRLKHRSEWLKNNFVTPNIFINKFQPNHHCALSIEEPPNSGQKQQRIGIKMLVVAKEKSRKKFYRIALPFVHTRLYVCVCECSGVNYVNVNAVPLPAIFGKECITICLDSFFSPSLSVLLLHVNTLIFGVNQCHQFIIFDAKIRRKCTEKYIYATNTGRIFIFDQRKHRKKLSVDAALLVA